MQVHLLIILQNGTYKDILGVSPKLLLYFALNKAESVIEYNKEFRYELRNLVKFDSFNDVSLTYLPIFIIQEIAIFLSR